MILSNLRSCNAFAGILNNPPPSPTNNAAVIGTFTSNLVGSTIALPEPDCILSYCKSSNAEAGILNNPPPSPSKRDADIEPLILTEPVNIAP